MGVSGEEQRACSDAGTRNVDARHWRVCRPGCWPAGQDRTDRRSGAPCWRGAEAKPGMQARPPQPAGPAHRRGVGAGRGVIAPPKPSSLFQVPLLEESGSTPMLAHIAWNWALPGARVGGLWARERPRKGLGAGRVAGRAAGGGRCAHLNTGSRRMSCRCFSANSCRLACGAHMQGAGKGGFDTYS